MVHRSFSMSTPISYKRISRKKVAEVAVVEVVDLILIQQPQQQQQQQLQLNNNSHHPIQIRLQPESKACSQLLNKSISTF